MLQSHCTVSFNSERLKYLTERGVVCCLIGTSDDHLTLYPFTNYLEAFLAKRKYGSKLNITSVQDINLVDTNDLSLLVELSFELLTTPPKIYNYKGVKKIMFSNYQLN